jgi:hypothetical protein
LLATGSASGAYSIDACTLTVKMAWHFSAWLHATGQLPSANRTWSAAVHDGQLTWNQEAGAVVPKPLGMAAGRQHGLNGKVHVLPHGKSFQKPLIKLSGRLLIKARQPSQRYRVAENA